MQRVQSVVLATILLTSYLPWRDYVFLGDPISSNKLISCKSISSPIQAKKLSFRYDQLFEFAHRDLRFLVDGIRTRESCGSNDVLDMTISLGGTWKKRGHQSTYIIVFLINADSGYCLDFETLSKRCEVCEAKGRSLTKYQFNRWVRQIIYGIDSDSLMIVFSTKVIDWHVRRTGMAPLGLWREKMRIKSLKDLWSKVEE